MELQQTWPKIVAYALVIGLILTVVSLLIKKYIDSDDEGQKKIGKQIAISVGVIGILILFVIGYTAMPEDKRNVVHFLLEFFPFLLLISGIGGLFYLVFPDNTITEDLKDIQKRMGIVAGVGTVIVAITAFLASNMILIDPGTIFFPFTITMLFLNMEIALLSFLSVFYGKQ